MRARRPGFWSTRVHCDSAAAGAKDLHPNPKPGDVELGGAAAKAGSGPELATRVKPTGAEAGSGL